jgi:hypothetical protein
LFNEDIILFSNYEQKWVNIMSTLIDDLKVQIANRNALVIVGAGVSLDATNNNPLAGWTGLLHDGAQRCVELNSSLSNGWVQRANAGIDSGDIDEMISYAEMISVKLGAPNGGEYSRWLRDSVGELKVAQQDDQRDVIKAIHKLDIPIATTNYDGLLEEVTDLKPITWMDGNIIERVLR